MRRFCLSLFLSILLCLMTVPLLSSCGPARRQEDFAYADIPFSLSVEGTYLPTHDAGGTPRPIAAEVTAGAPVDGDPTLRSLTVTFTAPEALAGVTITAHLTAAPDGTVSRQVVFVYPSDYGQIGFTAKGAELDGFLRFAEAWLPIGDVTEVSPKASDGSFTVTRRRGAREAVFTFTNESPLPLRVAVSDEHGRMELAVR